MKKFEHNEFTLEIDSNEIESQFSGKDLTLRQYKFTPKKDYLDLTKVSYVYKDSMKNFVVEVEYKTPNKNQELITKIATFDTELTNFQFKSEDNTNWLNMPIGKVLNGEHKGEQLTIRYVLINNKKIVMFHPEEMLKAIEPNKDNEQQAMALIFALRGAIYSIYGEDLDIFGLDVK